MSLRIRLFISVLVVVAVSLGVLGVVVVSSTREGLFDAVEEQLELALFNRTNAAPRPAAEDAPTDPRALATAHLVVGPRGDLIAAEPAGPPNDPTPLPTLTSEDIESLQAGKAVTVQSADRTLRYLALGVIGPSGQLEVEAAPLTSIDDTMASLIRRLLLGSLITLFLAIIAVLLVQWRALRPLEQVIETADAVAAGQREQRVPTDRGPTEIRELSQALDLMLQQQWAVAREQEERERRLRRFISDASHELQTPVTSVIGWAQLLRKGALDADERIAAVDRIESQGQRMSALVDELLVLARLDEHTPLERAPIDLAAITLDAVLDARAVNPGRSIEMDAETPVIVDGDGRRLRQVIDNLLRNVFVHTPPGSPASVQLQETDGRAILVVDDEGPGFDPDHLDDVFARFWRDDPSRSRATGGTGLGLAIVEGLVSAHDGTTTAANRPGGGASVTIELPIAGQACSECRTL